MREHTFDGFAYLLYLLYYRFCTFNCLISLLLVILFSLFFSNWLLSGLPHSGAEPTVLDWCPDHVSPLYCV